jgi:Tfp pilus assembly protein PilF
VEAFKTVPQLQLDEYEKAIQSIKARQDEKREQIDGAKDKYENATKLGRPSATAFYNYAAFLFKKRHDLDLNHKAL